MRAEFKFHSNNRDQQNWLNGVCDDFNKQVNNDDKLSCQIDEKNNRVIFYKTKSLKKICSGKIENGKLKVSRHEQNQFERKGLKNYSIKAFEWFEKKIGKISSKSDNTDSSFKWNKINKNSKRMQYLQDLLDASPSPKKPHSSKSNDNTSSGYHRKKNVDGKGRTENNQSVSIRCPESNNEYLNQSLLKFAEIKHKKTTDKYTKENLQKKVALDVLGVSFFADGKEIKKAYFNWIKMYHPDKFNPIKLERLREDARIDEEEKQRNQTTELFKLVSIVRSYF